MFYPYWFKIAYREMNKQIDRTFKHLSHISLDMSVTENGLTLHEIVSMNNEKESSLYDAFIEIAKDKRNNLSSLERYVIINYLSGYSLTEIAESTNYSKSKIYNSYSSAVKKIRAILVKEK